MFVSSGIDDVCDISGCIDGAKVMDLQECLELASTGSRRGEAGPFYAHFMLQWLRSMDVMTRHRVMLPRLLQTTGD